VDGLSGSRPASAVLGRGMRDTPTSVVKGWPDRAPSSGYGTLDEGLSPNLEPSLGLLLPSGNTFVSKASCILPLGLRNAELSIGHFPSTREPARDADRSLPVGVLRPLLVEGLLPLLLGVGKKGKAQSKFADSSGLGGLRSHNRGAEFVATGSIEGLLELLLLECMLAAGDNGACMKGGIGARKGWFAMLALIRGGGGRIAFVVVVVVSGMCFDLIVAARALV
jgi:hypothetical protein